MIARNKIRILSIVDHDAVLSLRRICVTEGALRHFLYTRLRYTRIVFTIEKFSPLLDAGIENEEDFFEGGLKVRTRVSE